MSGFSIRDDLLSMSFQEIVRRRHSVRAFQSQPVPRSMITEVLEEAQLTPSNGNSQPWNVHIVSGAARDRLSAALIDAAKSGKYSMDFSFSTKEFFGPYAARYEEQGNLRYAEEGIARDDMAARMQSAMRNYTFFGAPHVALLFTPSIGDCVRVAADVAMYGQTFLLSLTSKGLGGVPQTSVGMFADTVREVLGVSSDMKLLFAISFGYPDAKKLSNKHPGRAALDESVVFHDA